MCSKGFKFPVVNICSKPTEQELIMSRMIQGNTDVLRIKPSEAVSWYATAQSEKSHTIKLEDEDGNVYIDTEIQSIDLSNKLSGWMMIMSGMNKPDLLKATPTEQCISKSSNRMPIFIVGAFRDLPDESKSIRVYVKE